MIDQFLIIYYSCSSEVIRRRKFVPPSPNRS